MSEQKTYLKLPIVILININIMLGTGIFLNTTKLARQAGALGALSYLIIGVLMLPLVLSITELLRIHPTGGFYAFGSKEISPLVGFISTWTYFIGKLASATVGIHFAITLLQDLIPPFAMVNTFAADCTLIILFVLLNMLNMKTGGKIQTLFIVMKSLPILFVLLSGIFIINGAHFTAPHFLWAGLPATLPFVLYAILGFEAACSLSNSIENPEKNAPKAVLISFAIAILITALFQLIFYGALGNLFNQFTDSYFYLKPFPALTALLFPTDPFTQNAFAGICHIGIALSALGGAYGILFTNNWNLYTLAQYGHTYASSTLTQYNKHNIPWLCVVIEGLLCFSYLIITGSQIPILQQMGALGSVVTYTISVASLIAAKKNMRDTHIAWWIPLCGFMNCCILTGSCVYSLICNGLHGFLLLSVLLVFGIIMFYVTKQHAPLAQSEHN